MPKNSCMIWQFLNMFLCKVLLLWDCTSSCDPLWNFLVGCQRGIFQTTELDLVIHSAGLYGQEREKQITVSV